MTVGLVPEGPLLHTVGVYVHGRKFELWTDYRIENDIFTPSDGFSMRTGPLRPDFLKEILPGHRIFVYVSDGSPDGWNVIKDGWIESFRSSRNKTSTTYEIAGRDLASDLIENSLPVGFSVKNKSFVDMAEQVCGLFNIPVYVTNEAARLEVADRTKSKKLLANYKASLKEYNKKIKAINVAVKDRGFTDSQMKEVYAANNVKRPLQPPTINGVFENIKEAEPKDGESCWDFLVRYARRLEVYMWMSSDGALVIQRPRYDQDPMYLFVNSNTDPTINNVVSREYQVGIAGMPTSIIRTGRYKGEGKQRERLEATVESVKLLPESEAILIPQDSLVVSDEFSRTRWVTDTEARNQKELERRNFYSMKAAETSFISIQLTVQGHDQGGKLYTSDTVCRLVDEDLDIDGPYYISACTYTQDTKATGMVGKQTQLNLTPLYAWVPEEAIA